MVFLRNRQKVILWPKFFFLTRVKKNIFGQICVSRECFLTFLINFLFLKMLTKKSQKKKHFLAKISVFWAKNAKIFKNKKLIKKVRKHP